MITSIWTGPGEENPAAKELRRQVFQEELQIPAAEEWETQDAYAYHLVLLMNDTPVATGRITYGGVGTAKLSRICVLKKYRRQGIGDGLVKILDYKASQMGMRYSQVDADEELLPFYRRPDHKMGQDAAAHEEGDQRWNKRKLRASMPWPVRPRPRG